MPRIAVGGTQAVAPPKREPLGIGVKGPLAPGQQRGPVAPPRRPIFKQPMEGETQAQWRSRIAGATPAQVAAGPKGPVYPIVGADPFVTSPFGVDRGDRNHGGVDLRARFQPIVATVGGTVVRSDDTAGGYGTLVVVRDDEGYEHYYAHLSQRGVNVGDRVGGGQQIAVSGNSGNSTGPHLHYAVKDGRGNFIDPTPFVGAPIKAAVGSYTSVGGGGGTSGAAGDTQDETMRQFAMPYVWGDGAQVFDIVGSINQTLGITRDPYLRRTLTDAEDYVGGLLRSPLEEMVS